MYGLIDQIISVINQKKTRGQAKVSIGVGDGIGWDTIRSLLQQRGVDLTKIEKVELDIWDPPYVDLALIAFEPLIELNASEVFILVNESQEEEMDEFLFSESFFSHPYSKHPNITFFVPTLFVAGFDHYSRISLRNTALMRWFEEWKKREGHQGELVIIDHPKVEVGSTSSTYEGDFTILLQQGKKEVKVASLYYEASPKGILRTENIDVSPKFLRTKVMSLIYLYLFKAFQVHARPFLVKKQAGVTPDGHALRAGLGKYGLVGAEVVRFDDEDVVLVNQQVLDRAIQDPFAFFDSFRKPIGVSL